MSLTWHDLKERFANHLGNDNLRKDLQLQVELGLYGEIPRYSLFKIGFLPDDCSDILDAGHYVLYYHSDDNEERPEYSWNDLLADIAKMTPEQRMEQDVTVFDVLAEEVNQVHFIDMDEDGKPYLFVED